MSLLYRNGTKIIVPKLFLLIAFFICCLLSYAIGTSFGVAGTVGIIFMAIARSGGVNPVIAAGVLMSSIYFGDRCSPVSSSANMVAGITETRIMDNVKLMMRTGLLPFIITTAVYAVLSFTNPLSHVDEAVIRTLEQEFSISPWAFLPAVIVILLPLLKVGVITTILISIAAGGAVACLVQGVPIVEVLKICVLGYHSADSGIGAILNGGGIVSMVEIAFILAISSAYSGIFSGTHMLDALQSTLGKACGRFGRFAVMVVSALATSMVFCNQTIATLMCNSMLKKPYEDGGATKEELAIDMENSVILIACTVPWSIGCSVPLALLDTDARSVLVAAFMYLVPICYFFTKKKWFGGRGEKS